MKTSANIDSSKLKYLYRALAWFFVNLHTNSRNAMMNNLYLKLFLSFFKIGAFTFGGGWAMISIIEREIVDKHKWISKADFLDLLAVAQSMPGILAVNISVVIGDNLRGVKGSIVSALGTILPSFMMILAIAIFLTPDDIKNNELISSIFQGIRPAVVALIVAPVLTTARAANISWKTVWIPIATALLICSKLPFISNPITFIVLGGLGGYIYYVKRQNNAIQAGKEVQK